MKKSIRAFWQSATRPEKQALVVLGCLLAGIWLFVVGVKVGEALVPFL